MCTGLELLLLSTGTQALGAALNKPDTPTPPPELIDIDTTDDVETDVELGTKDKKTLGDKRRERRSKITSSTGLNVGASAGTGVKIL